jgi:hypothetical protein
MAAAAAVRTMDLAKYVIEGSRSVVVAALEAA